MPAPVRAAVAVILTREPDGRRGRPVASRNAEVLLVRRSPELRAFPGLWAFPGGTVKEKDRAAPVRGAPSPEEAGRVAAAARELFEETGVRLFRTRPPLDDAANEALRDRLLRDEGAFADLLRECEGEIRAGDFAAAAALTTSEAWPYRFDTRFYRASLPGGQAVSVRPGEIVDAVWLRPAEALDRWRQGVLPLPPPTLGLLERWSPDEREFRRRNRPAAGAVPVRYSPGVWVFPCRTPTLPPATHTNAILVGGEDRYLIDPAPEDPAERESLFRQVDGLLAGGARLRAVLVTHHHRDHIGSVAQAAARYGVPVGAHPETLARLPAGAAPPGNTAATLPLGGEEALPLHGGETLPLGEAPDGSAGWTLSVHFVPGHAPGHLAFEESRYRAMMLGDLVSSLSSILISPEDGDLAEYMESLQRLAGECRGVAYPGHGVPVIAGRELLERQVRHREAREERLLAALDGEPRELAELGRQVYPESEVPRAGPVRDLALASLESGLEKLRKENRARERGGRWAAA